MEAVSIQNLPISGERHYKFNRSCKPVCEINFEQQAEQQHQQQSQLQQEQQQDNQIQQQQQSAAENFDEGAGEIKLVEFANYKESWRDNYISILDAKKNKCLYKYWAESYISEYWLSAVSSSGGTLPNSIHALTLSAVRQLNSNHNMFIGGLNIDNLPNGFFVQKREKGLVLNYDEVRYIENKNKSPLTVSRFADVSIALAWLGDVIPNFINNET